MRFGFKTHIFRALLPGLAITAIIVCADSLGWLSPVENQLYDARARYCQQFVGPPTRKLIHLDIDDASLESIGRWPWPRSVLAEILDELRRADAKVVALDIILPDPQAPTYLPDGRGMIDNDAILAASIQKFGRVLVPVSFHFGRFTPQSSMERAIANQLQSSIRISFDTIKSSLDNRYPHITVDDYLPVLRNVVYDRIAAEMHRHQGTLEEIEKRLIGSDTTNINPLIPATIRVQYRIYESERAIERLGKSVDQPMPDVLRPLSALVMIPPLARAAAYTAFVDHLPHGDGVERSVPLWVLFNGRLYPQMGLALACATLGVPLDRLKISDSSLTIPLSDGKAIVIPTHSFYSKRLERRVGYLMDIPWFGTSDWTTMYDYPNHLKAEQHMPIGKVWELSQARRVAHQNNLQADKALKYLGDKWGLDDVNAFLAHRPDPEIIDSRIAIAKKALAESDDWARPLENEKRANLKPDEADFLDARSDLRTIIGNNQPIAALATQIKQSLRGKCILIGSIATSAFDFVTTPLHAQCPGVVVHGAIFNAIMQQHLLRTAPFADTAAAIVGVGVLATFAVTILSPWMALLATLLLLGGYAAINGFFLFAYEGTIVGAAGPLVAGALVWGGVTLMRYITEITERTRITRRFRAYADQKLVDYVLAHPEQNVFDGEEREMTCVFTDMQGYTSLVERLGKGVVPALNEYMGRMAAIIQEQGGYLNKFLGDGIMFFYGAPEHDPHHAQRAVRTVMEMRESGIPAFNQWLSEQGLDLHVSVRAGVTTGLMIVGDAGSQRRADYTVLGDSVNLASRLESANKHIGTMAMISERTAELCGGEFLLRPVAKIQVVGKKECVTAYEPLSFSNKATDSQIRLAELSREIFASFIAADFERCLQWLALAEKEFGSSKFFALYARQCHQNLKAAPPDFDGRIVLEEK